MIGTKFAKPLELDTLTRTVMRTVTREVEELEAVLDEDGTIIDYKPVTKTVTEEVTEQEPYDNPAPNTYTKYREAAQWCNANRAIMVDCGEYYEVQAIPEPTAEELAAQALEQAKAERTSAVASITVEVDGMVFDGDENAMRRMSNALTAAQSADVDNWRTVTVPWVLADNTVVTVTMGQLARALRGAMEAMAKLWVLPYS